MIEALRDLELQSPRVLDLGAYVGDFVTLSRGLWQGCYVACVEANELCLPRLRSMADDVKIALLADEDDEIRAYWMRDPRAQGGASGNSCYRERTWFFGAEEVANGNVREVQRRTTTLDSLYAREPAFDVVKLDLQGSELQAILGGPKTLRKASVVLCEQQRKEYNQGAPFAHEVDAAIRELGFRPHWESAHELVGKFQIDRMYVKVGSELDLKLRMRRLERPEIVIQREEEAEV